MKCDRQYDDCRKDIRHWKEVAQCVTRDKNNEIDKLKEILAELARLINPNDGARFDHCAGLFYTETGYMAPGKAVPLEMTSIQPSDDERLAHYIAWIKSYRNDLFNQATEAITGQSAAELVSDDG